MPVVEDVMNDLRNQLRSEVRIACDMGCGDVGCGDLFLGNGDASMLKEYLNKCEDMRDEDKEADHDENQDEEREGGAETHRIKHIKAKLSSTCEGFLEWVLVLTNTDDKASWTRHLHWGLHAVLMRLKRSD